MTAPLVVSIRGTYVPSYFESFGYTDDETGLEVEDLVYPAHSINPKGTAGGAEVSQGFLPGTLVFDQTTTEVCALTVYLIHHYKNGTDLLPHIHWAKAADGAGDVHWEMDYQLVRKGEVAGPVVTLTATGLDSDTPDNGLAGEHLETDFPPIPGATLASSDAIIVTLRRVPSNPADTYPDDAHLIQVDFHYQIDPYM